MSSPQPIVSVKIISPNRVLGVPPDLFLIPTVKGTAYNDTPCFSFLIEHEASGQKLLFDLGIRKDVENSVPSVVEPKTRECRWTASMLSSGRIGVFDHTGDAARFRSSTKLVVGPGFKDAFLPGYPANAPSPIPVNSIAGKEIHEVYFNDSSAVTYGVLKAVDWYGDRSCYLLETPGHVVGHMSCLARTTHGEADTFALLGGDCCHHPRELRPNIHCPLPREISPSPRSELGRSCPGTLFEAIHPKRSAGATGPFYEPAEGGFNLIAAEMMATLKHIERLDADPKIFTIISHNDSLLGIVDLFPFSVNRCHEKGWRRKESVEISCGL